MLGFVSTIGFVSVVGYVTVRNRKSPSSDRALPAGVTQGARNDRVFVYAGAADLDRVGGGAVLTARLVEEKTPEELDAIVLRQMLRPKPIWVMLACCFYGTGCQSMLGLFPPPVALWWIAAMLMLGMLTTWAFLAYGDRRAEREAACVVGGRRAIRETECRMPQSGSSGS